MAWVLACVFVRYMEDNDLIAESYLAGAGDRRRQAEDAHEAYFRAHPATATASTCSTSSAASARSRRRPTCSPRARRRCGPSAPRATGRRGCWPSGGRSTPRPATLVRSFRAEGGDTRFLGDLYQDLSEAARKKLRAAADAGVRRGVHPRPHARRRRSTSSAWSAIRLIDPTCGSGHFLLGAFRRLFARWREREPGDRAGRAGAAGAGRGARGGPQPVRGGDRPLPAARRGAARAASRRLAERPGWTVHIAVGDSLLHGDTLRPARLSPGVAAGLASRGPTTLYALEDAGRAGARSSAGSTTPSSATRPTSRPRTRRSTTPTATGTTTCHGKYSLGVPFTERFFDLAARGRRRPAGRLRRA